MALKMRNKSFRKILNKIVLITEPCGILLSNADQELKVALIFVLCQQLLRLQNHRHSVLLPVKMFLKMFFNSKNVFLKS